MFTQLLFNTIIILQSESKGVLMENGITWRVN